MRYPYILSSILLLLLSVNGRDIFVVTSDGSGEEIWHKTFGGNVDDTGYTGRQTADGGFILTGETYSSGEGGCDMVIIKVDQDGNLLE